MQVRRKIAIAGVTGRVGRHVVDLLIVTRRGDSVRVEGVSNAANLELSTVSIGSTPPGGAQPPAVSADIRPAHSSTISPGQSGRSGFQGR